jgi:simple sugar transport system permease protein
MNRSKVFFKEYGFAIALIALSIPLIPLSGLPLSYILQELLTRLGRNTILVLALLPMLYAGMGFNFALGLGAMAAQIGLILAVGFDIVGLPGLALATLIGIPIAVFLGWLCGLIMNQAKGIEMIIAFPIRFMFDGVYQFLVLYCMGTYIPISNQDVLLSRGYGIRNTINLNHMIHSLDQLLQVRLGVFTLPIGTYLAITAISLLLLLLLKTKLGQDIQAVGLDSRAAEEAGISVNRTRIKAVILSMIIACIGQVIFLQNMGNMATYGAHGQSTFYAIPALMVGGVTLRKIRIRHALIGIVVFHLFMMISPYLGLKLFGYAQASEYFRQFAIYTIIAIGLIRYGMERYREAEQRRQEQAEVHEA